MTRSADEDRLEGQRAPPGAFRNGRSPRCAQIESQFRIIAGLRAMYADLVAEPVPDRLAQLLRAFELRQEGARHDT
jgi:hypothetical protein